MSLPPELGSDQFDRWAKKVWPYCVGIFGMVLIVADIVFIPPPGPNTFTSGLGFACMTGMSYVGHNRYRRGRADDDD